MSLSPFYQIVDDAAWLERFLPLGLKTVQLRMKDHPQTHLRNQIRACKALCDQHAATLIINDHWQLALEEGCTWIHLGQEDASEADLAALRQKGMRIGISTHDEEERERALNWQADYIALGPIFPTILKTMKWAPQGIEKITHWKKAIGATPLVAIGGFTPERAEAAYQAGADSICVVTDVLLAQNPETRLQEWLNLKKP